MFASKLLVGVALAQKNTASAKRHLHRALSAVQSINAAPLKLEVLVEAAACLEKSRKRQQALTLLHFVYDHPACHAWIKDQVQVPLETLKGALSSRTWTHAQRQARGLDLDEAIKRLLAEVG